MVTSSTIREVLTKERVFAILVLLVVALAYWETFKFSSSLLPTELGDSATYPRLLLIGIFILALITLLRPQSGAEDGASEVSAPSVLRKYAKPLSAVGLFALYIAALQPLGFLLSSILFLLVVQLVTMRKRDKRSVLAALAIAFLIPFLLEFVFTEFLGVILP